MNELFMTNDKGRPPSPREDGQEGAYLYCNISSIVYQLDERTIIMKERNDERCYKNHSLLRDALAVGTMRDRIFTIVIGAAIAAAIARLALGVVHAGRPSDKLLFTGQ